jgi:hypothetical protein
LGISLVLLSLSFVLNVVPTRDHARHFPGHNHDTLDDALRGFLGSAVALCRVPTRSPRVFGRSRISRDKVSGSRRFCRQNDRIVKIRNVCEELVIGRLTSPPVPIASAVFRGEALPVEVERGTDECQVR